MKVLEHSSPLLVPTYRFDDLEDYLNSLSKSSRHDLKKTLDFNSDLRYDKVDFNLETCRRFMNLWAKCNNWNWGDWYSDRELQSLHDRGVLHCFSCGPAYHFVLKWGDYIYCNAPLYDKNSSKGAEISKWMWVKLIQYCIENKWVAFVDLMGPEKFKTYGEVIKNRQHTNESGDFGYKWKFVPKDIKEGKDTTLNHLEIVSDKVFVWKGIVSLPQKPEKLLVVAHPDDEAIFFGDWLMENGPKTKVICLTSSMDYDIWWQERRINRYYEFQNCLKEAGVVYFECFGAETPSLDPFKHSSEYKNFLKRISWETDWQQIVTHNKYGEYGHMQHIETHDLVKDVFPKDRMFVYKNSKKKLSTNKKQVLLNQYPSQQKYGINEIRASEWTGSDWYKHTVGKNMIDYESLEKLTESKDSLLMTLYWGGEVDHYTFDFVNGLSGELECRGHQAVVSRILESWPWDPDVLIVFRKEDAIQCINKNKPFFFIINDETLLNEQKFEEYGQIVDKSVRSFTQSWKMRNQIGDRINLVWVPRHRKWYSLIRKIEAHLYMGLVGND